MEKTLILDIDNTLIEPLKPISTRNFEALQRFCQANGQLVFATGKSACALTDLISDLQLTHGYAIVSNGGALYNIATKQLEELSVVGHRSAACMKVLTDLAYPFYAYYEDKIVITQPMPQEELDYLAFLKDPKVVLQESIDPSQVVKLMMFIDECEVEKQQRLEKSLDVKNLGLHFVRTATTLLEIHDQNQTKATGIHALSEKLQVDVCEMIAVGDSENDLPMLLAVGHPYLVDNASMKMKQYGFLLLPSCRDDGVATLIDQLFLKNSV